MRRSYIRSSMSAAFAICFLNSAALYRSLSPISFFHGSIPWGGSVDASLVLSFRNTSRFCIMDFTFPAVKVRKSPNGDRSDPLTIHKIEEPFDHNLADLSEWQYSRKIHSLPEDVEMSFVFGVHNNVPNKLCNSQGLSRDERVAVRAHRCKIHLRKSRLLCIHKR